MFRILRSSFSAYVPGVVVVKLASSTDMIQAAVVLHPGRITEEEIDGKSPSTPQALVVVLLMACCVRC